MRARSRRRPGPAEHAVDEGPFVSFTDLFIGILFLFLILVAALMLMHQEAVRLAKAEAQLTAAQLQQMQLMQAKLDEAAKAADHPAFRLGIVFNIYQRPAGANAEWTFSRTVQVFRAPNGLCINNVILRSNLSTAWKPPVGEEDIPTANDQDFLRRIEPCGISATGDQWNLPSETGSLKRVSRDLYSGGAVLHKQGGDVVLEMQYRVLGVYDDYFR